MIALASSQALLIGLVLLVAGGAKVSDGFGRSQARQTALGVLLPSDTLALLTWRGIAIAEVLVGILVLAFPSSPVPSAAAAFLLLGATAYAVGARGYAPERPCGCFGGASKRPTSIHTVVRAGVLAVGAIGAAASGAGWIEGIAQRWPITVIVLEAVLLLRFSPETRTLRAWIEQRRSRLPACLFRDIPVETTLRTLTRSAPWSELRSFLISDEPADQWRQDCWQYLSYSARIEDKQVIAIFAVHLPPSRSSVRAALVDENSGHVTWRVGNRERGLRWMPAGGHG